MLVMPTDAAGRSRLLPASLPMRHFGAAALFHLLGWLIVAAYPRAIAGFAGGMGPALAALHGFTLGALTMTALGASLQLMPVATVQPVRSVRIAQLVWWPLVGSIGALVAGLARVDTMLAAIGAVGTLASLAVHAALLAANLRGARRGRAMTAFAACALVGLFAVIASGPALVLHYHFDWFADPRGLALAHLIAACYGYLGLLTAGFSYLLVSMFMVARAPPEDTQRRVLVAAATAIVAAVALALAGASRAWLALPAALGLAAAIVHARHMLAIAARRRTRDAPWSLALMRIAWVALPANLALALALALLGPSPRLALAFVALTVLGWLTSFVLAVVMRIVPFLASVHVKLRGARMPLVSALTPAGPARAVAAAHPAALALLVGGVFAGRYELVAAAGAVGAVGALALIVFLIDVFRRARVASATRGA